MALGLPSTMVDEFNRSKRVVAGRSLELTCHLQKFMSPLLDVAMKPE
jgi:hypothetical protein